MAPPVVDARRAIAAVDFVGWQGLPPGCAAGELFDGLPQDSSGWAVRPLGERYINAAFRVLELPGYYRPTVSVRDGELVLFDGMNPQLDGGLERLRADLGAPAAQLDYRHGTLPVPGGELVHAERGLTLFVNTTADRALHVAVYRATTLDDYRDTLRPHLGKTLRPAVM